MSLVQHEIGTAAGDVYRYLFENGETSLTRLGKALEIPNRRVDQALGWLAREDKVTFTQSKRTTLVSVREE